MKRWLQVRSVLSLVLAAIALNAATAFAQVTTFTYQGKLTSGGSPAAGSFDMVFTLYDTPTIGTGTPYGVPSPNVRNAVAVDAGVFTVPLDFDIALTGPVAPLYLEIGVRPAGGGAYTTLAPRQQLTASPYAIQTLNAQTLGNLPASRYVATDVAGNVGLGTSPSATVRLTSQSTVNSDAISGVATGGGVGVRGSSVSGTGVYGTTAAAHSYDHAGVWGVSTGDGGIGVNGQADTGTAWGVYGHSASSSGVGVVAQNGAGGPALLVDGPATQSAPFGGLVKAMVQISFSDGAIVRCFNGITGSTAVPCGFSTTRPTTGTYTIDFGFQAGSRFIVLQSLATYSGTEAYFSVFPSSNVISVKTEDKFGPWDIPFYVLVF